MPVTSYCIYLSMFHFNQMLQFMNTWKCPTIINRQYKLKSQAKKKIHTAGLQGQARQGEKNLANKNLP